MNRVQFVGPAAKPRSHFSSVGRARLDRGEGKAARLESLLRGGILATCVHPRQPSRTHSHTHTHT